MASEGDRRLHQWPPGDADSSWRLSLRREHAAPGTWTTASPLSTQQAAMLHNLYVQSEGDRASAHLLNQGRIRSPQKWRKENDVSGGRRAEMSVSTRETTETGYLI